MNHKIKSGLLLLALGVQTTSVSAGASNALLKCRSSRKIDGKVIRVEGDIPGDFAEFNLKITHGTDTVELRDANGDRIYALDAWRDGVFTVVVDGSNALHGLRIYAVPTSVKSTVISGGERVQFDAVAPLLAKPGFQGEVSAAAFYHDVKLKCSW